jgi:hypothetical protein
LFQIVDFCSVNDLKFTYALLQFQIFYGVIPRTPVIKGRRGEEIAGEGREERGWDGMNSPKQILSTALLLSYAHVTKFKKQSSSNVCCL